MGKRKNRRKKHKENQEDNVEQIKSLNLPNMLIQGVATSIDALCIGFVYSPLEYNILNSQLIFLTIGVVTFVLSSITTLTGKKVGKYLINWAGLIAGIVFIAIGLKILLEHYI